MSPPLSSLYVAGRGHWWLCCQDAAKTLVVFWLRTSQACVLCPCPSSTHQRRELWPVKSKFEATAVIGWAAERAEMYWVVVWEPWCARCRAPFVKDTGIIVDESRAFSSYRTVTATQWGSQGKRGGTVAVKMSASISQRTTHRKPRSQMYWWSRQMADNRRYNIATCTQWHDIKLW